MLTSLLQQSYPIVSSGLVVLSKVTCSPILYRAKRTPHHLQRDISSQEVRVEQNFRVLTSLKFLSTFLKLIILYSKRLFGCALQQFVFAFYLNQGREDYRRHCLATDDSVNIRLTTCQSGERKATCIFKNY